MSSDKKGIAIAIVGMTGTGKSTEVINILNKTAYPKFIYDVNGEYASKNIPGAITNLKFPEFLKEATTKKRHVIVFEEATIFFQHGKSSEEVMDLLIRKRHKELVLIFVFHSLRTIPVFITDYLDCILIKKTNDRGDIVKKKFANNPEIYEAYLRCLQLSEQNQYHTEEVMR